MTRILSALAIASLALTGTAASAQSAQEEGEAELAEMIEGRIAGEPQSCITAMRSDEIEVIEHVGVVYDAGDTIWVARAKNPRSLGYNDVPIFERFGSQLCTTDIVRTIDRYAHFTTGSVFLEDFVPYEEQADG